MRQDVTSLCVQRYAESLEHRSQSKEIHIMTHAASQHPSTVLGQSDLKLAFGCRREVSDTKAYHKQVQRVTVIFTCVVAADNFYLLTDAVVFEL